MRAPPSFNWASEESPLGARRFRFAPIAFLFTLASSMIEFMTWTWMMARVRLGASVGLLGLAGCPDDVTGVETEGGSGGSRGSSTGESADTTGGLDTTGSTDDGLDTGTDESSTGDPPPPEIDPIPDPAGLSATLFGSCRVDDDGTLTCWGDGSCGVLGDGGDLARPPTIVAADVTWASVASGRGHRCGIADDRSLWCWGDGDDGKVGDGVLDTGLPIESCRFELMEIAPGAEWARLSLGTDHSCGVQTDGTLWCWGSNESAQIGDGAVGPLYTRLEPVEVGGTAWIDVYAGDEHTCALDGAGTAWCWGRGDDGELGQEGFAFSSVPVEVPGVPPLQELARGGTSRSACGVTTDGALWCWGSNDFGSAGRGIEGPVFVPAEIEVGAPVAMVAMGRSTSCAAADDGRAWCWGLGSSGQLGDGVVMQSHMSLVPVQLPGEAWVELTVGGNHVCGRTDDEQTLCWGDNEAGQVGDGTSGPDNLRVAPAEVGPWGGGTVADDWAGVSLGSQHGCGRRLDGSMWCWGNRRSGRLGNDDPTDDCSAGNPSACGVTTPLPVSPAGAGAWEDPQVGSDHACARQDDGTLWCWGGNTAGQLGYEGDPALVPTSVGVDTDWMAVATGDLTTCGLRSPGTLWCWGSNGDGVLGIGVDGGPPVPMLTQVGMEVDWTSVALGEGSHACGLRSDDSLWCWGRNDFGQAGQGMNGDPVLQPAQVPGTWAAVAVGALHTCAIATDGALWCWGRAEDGELGVGPVGEDAMFPSPIQVGAQTDWAQVVASGSYSCGRRADGTLWCWGRNSEGQVGQGEVDDPLMFDSPTQVGMEADWDDLTAWSTTTCGRRGATQWCWGWNLFGQQGNDTIFTRGVPQEVRNDG